MDVVREDIRLVVRERDEKDIGGWRRVICQKPKETVSLNLTITML